MVAFRYHFSPQAIQCITCYNPEKLSIVVIILLLGANKSVSVWGQLHADVLLVILG